MAILASGCGSSGAEGATSAQNLRLIPFDGNLVSGTGNGDVAGVGNANTGGPRGPVSPGTGIPFPFPSGGNNGALLPQFRFYATQTPRGPFNQNPSSWGGVLGFFQQSDGSTAPITGIPVGDPNIFDPAGLTFRSSSSEVLVSNRHGNNSTGGLAGSIARYRYDPLDGSFTHSATFAVAAPAHQSALTPAEDELFVAIVGAGENGFTAQGVQHFAIDNNSATFLDTIGNGSTRGVALSPDGTRLYVTSAGATIRQFDLTTTGNPELTPVSVSGSPNFHYMVVLNRELYVAALDGDAVFRFTIESNNDLTFKDSFSAPDPLDIAISPDGREMLVSQHADPGVIRRFTYDATNDTWVFLDDGPTGSALGGILALP